MTFNKNLFIDVNCIKNSFDFNLFKGIWNVGIDSHLEAFIKSRSLPDSDNPARFVFLFHRDEIPILLRRLNEHPEEEWQMWARDISLVANEKFNTNYETFV